MLYASLPYLLSSPFITLTFNQVSLPLLLCRADRRKTSICSCTRTVLGSNTGRVSEQTRPFLRLPLFPQTWWNKYFDVHQARHLSCFTLFLTVRCSLKISPSAAVTTALLKNVGVNPLQFFNMFPSVYLSRCLSPFPPFTFSRLLSVLCFIISL